MLEFDLMLKLECTSIPLKTLQTAARSTIRCGHYTVLNSSTCMPFTNFRVKRDIYTGWPVSHYQETSLNHIKNRHEN